MTFESIKLWIFRIVFGYILIGSIYFVSGFVYNLLMGKQIIISSIVGFPLTIISWPWMISADLIHHHTLGIRIPTVFTNLSMGMLLTLMILTIVKAQRFGH